MILLKKIAKVLILLVVVTLIINSAYIAHAQAPTLTKSQIYDFKMEQWLDKVEWHESNDKASLNQLDVNGQYSRGCLQFQDWTWDHYSKEFGIVGSPFDCTKAREVAVDMINSDYNLWRSWYNSTLKVGLPPVREG